MLTITWGATLICLRPSVRVCSRESQVASPELQGPRRGSGSDARLSSQLLGDTASLRTPGSHQTRDKPLPVSAPRLKLKESNPLAGRELGNLIKEMGFSFPEAENCVPNSQGISEPPWPLKVKERRTRSHKCHSPTVSCDNKRRQRQDQDPRSPSTDLSTGPAEEQVKEGKSEDPCLAQLHPFLNPFLHPSLHHTHGRGCRCFPL